MNNATECGVCGTVRGLLPLGFLVCAAIVSQLPLDPEWHRGAAYLAAASLAFMLVATIAKAFRLHVHR